MINDQVKEKPLISVIVPVFDVAVYLEQCITSILRQTYPRFELILSDDGSTDASGRICDTYAGLDDRVKVIHEENAGLSAARNRGLRIAQGTYIVFVDGDDWVEETMLETVAHYAKTGADLIRFNLVKEYEDGQQEKQLFFAEHDTIRLNTQERRFGFMADVAMCYKTGWEACAAAWRKDVMEEGQLFFTDTKTVFAEDYLFSMRFLLRARTLMMDCNVLYHYRQRQDSLLHKADNATILPRLRALAQILYDDICTMRLRLFRRRFYLLYYRILDYHIRYRMKDDGIDEILKQIKALHTAGRPLRWYREMCRHRAELVDPTLQRVWL